MGIEKKDLEMLALSVPTMDLWELREDLDRLEDAVNRLEKVVESMIELYREERVKSWEMILQGMLKEQRPKENYGKRIR